MPDAVDREPCLPFDPAPREAPVTHRMPPSVPPGLRLELSRSRIRPGWEELQPKLMLTPDLLRQLMQRFARTGTV